MNLITSKIDRVNFKGSIDNDRGKEKKEDNYEGYV